MARPASRREARSQGPTDRFERNLDLVAELRTSCKVFAESIDEHGHPLLESDRVFLLLRRTDEAPGREGATGGFNLGDGRCGAEPGLVDVDPSARLATPRVVRAGDPRYLIGCQLDLSAADLLPHRPSVDEQRLSRAVTWPRPARLIAIEEPQADRDAGRVEQLPRKGDDAVHEIGLHKRGADRAFATAHRCQRTVREDEAGSAIRS